MPLRPRSESDGPIKGTTKSLVEMQKKFVESRASAPSSEQAALPNGGSQIEAAPEMPDDESDSDSGSEVEENTKSASSKKALAKPFNAEAEEKKAKAPILFVSFSCYCLSKCLQEHVHATKCVSDTRALQLL